MIWLKLGLLPLVAAVSSGDWRALQVAVPAGRGQHSSLAKRPAFEGCQAGTHQFPSSLDTLAEEGKQHQSSTDEVEKITAQYEMAGCAASEIALENFVGGNAPQVTCCPAASQQCSGCAKYNKGSKKCELCRPGWVPMCSDEKCSETLCIACKDIPYTDTEGKGCHDVCPKTPKILSKSEIATLKQKGTEGVSADVACCACGGGIKQPTPFAYDDNRDLVLGQKVELFPSPRTASHYAVSSDCNLQDYGLSVDSSTGVISGKPLTKESFETSCVISAVEDPQEGRMFNGTLKLRFLPYSYDHQTVLLAPGDKYAIRKAPGRTPQIGSYSINCNPRLDWLDTRSFWKTGELSAKTSLSGSMGGLSQDRADIVEELHSEGYNKTDVGADLMNVAAGKCQVKLLEGAKKTDPEVTGLKDVEAMQEQKFTFIAMFMSRWPSIQYPDNTLRLTAGLRLHASRAFLPFNPKAPPASAKKPQPMAPIVFSLSCKDNKITHELTTKNVLYTTTSGRKIPLFDLDPLTGEIMGGPALAVQSDDGLDMKFNSATQRGEVSFACRIAGRVLPTSKNSDKIPWILSPWITFTIQESDAWQPLVLMSNQLELAALAAGDGSEEKCRKACREDATCPMYVYAGRKCSKGRKVAGQGRDVKGATAVNAAAKLTLSSPDSTCMQLDVDNQGWLSGTFCPVVRDLEAKDYVYQKIGFTPNDVAYLMKAHPATDFLDDKTATFQLRGRNLACIPERSMSWRAGSPPSNKDQMVIDVFFDDAARNAIASNKKSNNWGLTRSPRPCGNPLIPAAAEEEKEEEEEKAGSSTASEEEGETNDKSSSTEAFTIHSRDVPSPPGAASFSLDPCECFPVEWGPTVPVSAQQFEKLPKEGENRIPALTGPPQMIARGKLMCVLEHLIETIQTGDISICTQKCRDDSGCNFFWVGMAASVGQCRLFSSCGALMTEFGTEEHVTNGALFGVARYDTCLIADPEPYFRVLCGPVNYDEAKGACANEGMTLAKISSPSKAEISVAALAAACGGKITSAYVDGTDSAKEGSWKYSDGSPMPWAPWSGNEPNNWGGNEDCIAIYKGPGANDIPCSHRLPGAICEPAKKTYSVFCQNGKTWTRDEAYAFCKTKKMELAVVDSHADMDGAFDGMSESCPRAAKAWVDGKKVGSDWKFSDGKTMQFFHWMVGKPGNQPCMWVDGVSGRMEDSNCGARAASVVCYKHTGSSLVQIDSDVEVESTSEDSAHALRATPAPTAAGDSDDDDDDDDDDGPTPAPELGVGYDPTITSDDETPDSRTSDGQASDVDGAPFKGENLTVIKPTETPAASFLQMRKKTHQKKGTVATAAVNAEEEDEEEPPESHQTDGLADFGGQMEEQMAAGDFPFPSGTDEAGEVAKFWEEMQHDFEEDDGDSKADMGMGFEDEIGEDSETDVLSADDALWPEEEPDDWGWGGNGDMFIQPSPVDDDAESSSSLLGRKNDDEAVPLPQLFWDGHAVQTRGVDPEGKIGDPQLPAGEEGEKRELRPVSIEEAKALLRGNGLGLVETSSNSTEEDTSGQAFDNFAITQGWTGWVNGWDGWMDYQCPGNSMFSGVQSHHHNRKEDRQWRWKCGYLQGFGRAHCRWLGWTGHDWHTWTRECNHLEALVRVQSGHDNRREDRNFHFLCCRVMHPGRTIGTHWTGRLNWYDQWATWDPDANWLMRGMNREWYDNRAEDWRQRVIYTKSESVDQTGSLGEV
uniref:C-type lectin domain-containing protein n=1 Tax=Chromera velia CCMP2878 TaxID=1169474 RepID=A0A0G4GGQ5_9ALVE|eukprot:Cvel_21834.t1-p1 / transcript=Cvel_21834.t1 / gene=Cvel_21834 / organism=Chromera_velia_CCMP2878 / gene_product=Hemagglutinin/amebocyte aggregation factor, putative / transcript_product=Hemagglutinin/amebocyte aggregation factor, putative / location=Cvel_scaffold2084:20863-33934(+) / protein_length=1720 / sequence_SO=supercontig / SO=protein_coding / is_pseudo=false